MASQTTMTTLAFCCLLLTFACVSAQPDPESLDTCIAEATASTDPQNAAADALANSVAQATTKTVQCGEGAQASPSDISGLSVAVALAISQTTDAEIACLAEADAEALDMPSMVAERVTDMLANGLLGQLEGDPVVLAEAWLERRGRDIEDIIKAQQMAVPQFVDGCIDLDSLASGLPTAVELGLVLEDAIGQILEAVQCGTNLEPSEQECTWENRKFIGNCAAPQGYAAPGLEGRRRCQEKFIKCRNTKDLRVCTQEKKWCFQSQRD